MTSQTEAARAVAYALNDLLVCNASAGTTGTITLGELINPASGASAGRYDDVWVYGVTGTNAGSQRAVTKGGYVPSTGIITLSIGYGVAPSAGNVFDLTTLFPRAAGSLKSDTSYRNLLLAGMRRVNVRRRIPVAITTATQISLSLWAEWISPERVLRIHEPSPSGRLMPSAWREWTVVDGQAPVLECKKPFAQAGGNLILDVVTPAYTWIAPASTGIWNESSTGFSAEGDASIATVEHIREATLVEAYRVLMHRGISRPSGNYAALFEAQQDWCRQNIQDYDFGAPPQAAPQQGQAA